MRKTEAELEVEVEKCTESAEANTKMKTDLAKMTAEMESLIKVQS